LSFKDQISYKQWITIENNKFSKNKLMLMLTQNAKMLKTLGAKLMAL